MLFFYIQPDKVDRPFGSCTTNKITALTDGYFIGANLRDFLLV